MIDDEKACCCHPSIPDLLTSRGFVCAGCGWGGRADLWIGANDVRPPRPAEVEPPIEDHVLELVA